MTDTKLDSCRAQIDRLDEAITAAIKERVWWAKRAQEDYPTPRRAYAREQEIGARYAEMADELGVSRSYAYVLAGVLIDMGLEASRVDKAKANSPS